MVVNHLKERIAWLQLWFFFCAVFLSGCVNDNDAQIPHWEPKLSLDYNFLEFRDSQYSIMVRLENPGNSYLEWNIRDYRNWLDLSNSSGVLNQGDWDTIRVTVHPHLLDPGVINDVIVFKNNSMDSLFELPFSIEVNPTPFLSYDTSDFVYYINQDSLIVYLENTGNSLGNWSLYFSSPLIHADKSSLNIFPDEIVPLILIVDRDQIQDTLSLFQLILSTGQSHDTVVVRVPHHLEYRIPLNYQIEDMEFCPQTQELHFISNASFENGLASPDSLYGIWDLSSGNLRTVVLPYAPLVMDLAQGCASAAVSSQSFVTVIGIDSLAVVESFAVYTSVTPVDVAISQAGWVYVAGYGTFSRFQSFAIGQDSSTSISSTAIRLGDYIRLTPDENYFFLYESYYSDLTLVDISAEKAVLDIPQRDVTHSGELFLIENGARAINRNGNVYEFDPALDPFFQSVGQIEATSSLLEVVEVPGKNIFLATYSSGVNNTAGILFINSNFEVLDTLLTPLGVRDPSTWSDERVHQTPLKIIVSSDGLLLTLLTERVQDPYASRSVYYEQFDLQPIYDRNDL